jgi:hypothetical protein
MSSAMRGLIVSDGPGGPGGHATAAGRLSLRGHSDDRIKKVLGTHLLRVFGATWAT